MVAVRSLTFAFLFALIVDMSPNAFTVDVDGVEVSCPDAHAALDLAELVAARRDARRNTRFSRGIQPNAAGPTALTGGVSAPETPAAAAVSNGHRPDARINGRLDRAIRAVEAILAAGSDGILAQTLSGVVQINGARGLGGLSNFMKGVADENGIRYRLALTTRRTPAGPRWISGRKLPDLLAALKGMRAQQKEEAQAAQ